MAPTLEGRTRVLVIEDDRLTAQMVAELLREIGCEVIGPTSRLIDSIEAMNAERVDACILDLDLHGRMSYPLARLLRLKGIPFLIVSAYEPEPDNQDVKDTPYVGKPFSEQDLVQALNRLIQPAAPD